MTKAEALYRFYNSFDMPAYPQSNVPEDVIFPYLTYENVQGNNGTDAYPTINLYYYTESEAEPNAKADEISKAIGQGISIKSDDGAVYVFHEATWQAVVDDSISALKRRYTNFHLVFNTF